jgi:response regulator RpfG family c-di-GMP phosphodiesterase
LRYAGYTVLEAESAEVALCLGRGYDGAIDLLLTDVLMPRMSGAALADRFAALHPETRYLFMAGLPNHPEVVAGVLERGRPFLPKPFPMQQLLQRVAEVLAEHTFAAKSGR